MATSESIRWDVCERCAENGGIGVRLLNGGRCWAHAGDQDIDAALKRLGEDGHLDARGVSITSELLERLLVAAPKDDQGRTVLTDSQFDEAIFKGEANFSNATFEGGATFIHATFEGFVRFIQANFRGDAAFHRATFHRGAFMAVADGTWFAGAIFRGAAMFNGATFLGYVTFREAHFLGRAGFFRTAFHDSVSFIEATFDHPASFAEAAFDGNADFGKATFRGDVAFRGDSLFHGPVFQRGVSFDGATFLQARQLGPILVRKTLVLDGAVFHERAQIEVAAAAVCCQGARFLAGVQLRLRWAHVVLDDADLAAPSILAGVPPFPGPEEGQWARAMERLLPQPRFKPELRARPRLLSVRRADVAGLTVANVDLRACRFVGAHHLDQLRLEDSSLGYTPRGWRWTTRLCIAEERAWRANPHRRGIDTSFADEHATNAIDRRSGAADRDSGWYGPANRPPAWLAVEPSSPAQIAAIYRALRKGREDSRDEPGAADFYYGEMEMRRHDKRRQAKDERRARHFGHWAGASTERMVLWLYWLVSGYGLRAWRALAALALVIGLVGVGFSRVGFHHPHPSQLVSWLYALQATVSLEGKARQLSGQLTLPGELLRVALRFTGPVLLGLALLSIRGRVKR
jgi:uncharacterized protein YjbI with pentapeptide repeats